MTQHEELLAFLAGLNAPLWCGVLRPDDWPGELRLKLDGLGADYLAIPKLGPDGGVFAWHLIADDRAAQAVRGLRYFRRFSGETVRHVLGVFLAAEGMGKAELSERWALAQHDHQRALASYVAAPKEGLADR